MHILSVSNRRRRVRCYSAQCIGSDGVIMLTVQLLTMCLRLRRWYSRWCHERRSAVRPYT